MDWISVADASRVLGVSEQQVRRLASSGDLVARRFPGGWLLAESSVRERAHAGSSPGRPPSAVMCWRILRALSESVERGKGGGDQAVSVLAGIDDRKIRFRMRQLLASAPPIEQWPAWLRRRGELRRVWVHPGVVTRLRGDSRVHSDGGAVAALVGLSGSESSRLYVREGDFGMVMSEYRGRDEVDGEVEFMLVPSVAGDVLYPEGAPVPVASALLDLLESAGARERHAAARALSSGLARVLGRA